MTDDTKPQQQPADEVAPAGQNTDRELWSEREGDYYADSIFVGAQNGIGISCGGYTIVNSVRGWHRLARGFPPQQQPDDEVVELRAQLRADAVAQFIEFAPAFKTVNPKPAEGNPAFGTFWYAEGWIGGERYEFSTQLSQPDAHDLCYALNTVARAAIAAMNSAAPSESPKHIVTLRDTPTVLYVKFSSDGLSIRKWSSRPFRGATEYSAARTSGEPEPRLSSEPIDAVKSHASEAAARIRALEQALREISGYSEVNGMTRNKMRRIARISIGAG